MALLLAGIMVVRRRAVRWAGRVPTNERFGVTHACETNFEGASVRTNHDGLERALKAWSRYDFSARAAHMPALILSAPIRVPHVRLITGRSEDTKASAFMVFDTHGVSPRPGAEHAAPARENWF